MNKIEQEIHDESYKDIIKEARVIRINQAYSLLEKHCKAFAEFYFINEFNSSKENCLTTEQLFKLYIEQL